MNKLLCEVQRRGFDISTYKTAVESGDEELATLTHPVNWMTEEEAETPGNIESVLQSITKGE